LTEKTVKLNKSNNELEGLPNFTKETLKVKTPNSVTVGPLSSNLE